MRNLIIFLLSICFLLLACKKNVPVNSNPGIAYGTLYDSLTGHVIPGQTIYFENYLNGTLYDTAHTVTNQNGIFVFSFSSSKPNEKGNLPASWHSWYYTSFDSMAGAYIFNNDNLNNSSGPPFNIYAKPYGILALTIKDTSHVSICQNLIWNSIVGDFCCGPVYDAQHNGYADTTYYLKIYGNTYVLFGMGDGASTGPYVRSRDTTKYTVYF